MVSENKPVAKVYINMKKMIKDLKEKYGTRFHKGDMSNFVIRKGTERAKFVSFIRKTREDSKYELTLTEAYNLAIYLELSFAEFIDKYTKAQ